jgi:hypothetical protein
MTDSNRSGLLSDLTMATRLPDSDEVFHSP